MKVFVWQSDSYGYESLLADVQHALFYSQFDGTPGLARSWVPVRVAPVREDDEPELPQGDFPNFVSSVPVVSEAAAVQLAEELRDAGELLELRRVGTGEPRCYFALHVTKVIDALDFSASRILRTPVGRIASIEEYVLRPEVIKSAGIFKLRGLEGRKVFVTDKFVDRVTTLGLKGAMFTKVWES